MSFSTDLDDAVSRVRFAVGDIGASELFGDAVYEAALTAQGDDEPAATRQVAAGLAAYYANQPSSISSNGSSITWGERIKQWNLIAAGTAGGSSSGVGFSVRTTRNDGYYTNASSTAEF